MISTLTFSALILFVLATCETSSICSDGVNLVPHPTACQRYYNCSQGPEPWDHYFQKFEAECPYPQLFDERELKCKPFNETFCDTGRVAAKAPCDYLANRCPSIMCQPCDLQAPSCVGYPDGLFQHPTKPDSPYKMHCVSERTYQILLCLPPNTTQQHCEVNWQAEM